MPQALNRWETDPLGRPSQACGRSVLPGLLEEEQLERAAALEAERAGQLQRRKRASVSISVPLHSGGSVRFFPHTDSDEERLVELERAKGRVAHYVVFWSPFCRKLGVCRLGIFSRESVHFLVQRRFPPMGLTTFWFLSQKPKIGHLSNDA